MSYEWSIDRAMRTVFVRGSGAGTTAHTLKLIDDLAATHLDCVGWDLLYDAAELRIESTPTDIIRVAGALFDQVGARFRRCAIVVPHDRVGLGRIFAALADPYGVSANVFADIDSAREWLAIRRRAMRTPRPPRLELPEP